LDRLTILIAQYVKIYTSHTELKRFHYFDETNIVKGVNKITPFIKIIKKKYLNRN